MIRISLRGHNLHVLSRHGRIADGQPRFAAEIDVLKNDIGDRRFRQADDGAGHGGAGCSDIFDHDVVEVRREARDRRGRHGSFGRQNARIILADDERVLHVFHVDVAEDEIADVVAAVAIGLDANAVVGAVEVNALGEDVARAAGDLAADGEAVAVEEGAIGNGDVAAGFVAAGRVDGAGLDGDVVVADIGIEMIDANVRRGEGIDGVGVRRVLRRENADVVNDDVVRVVGNELPHGRILDGDSLDAHVLAVVEDDEARARDADCP